MLTDKQTQRLYALFATDEHVQVEAGWGNYRRMITAHREPDRARGRELMTNLVEWISNGVRGALRGQRTRVDPQGR